MNIKPFTSAELASKCKGLISPNMSQAAKEEFGERIAVTAHNLPNGSWEALKNLWEASIELQKIK